MKQLKILSFVISLLLSAVLPIIIYQNLSSDNLKIEQDVGEDKWDDGYRRFFTFVWSDGDIVWSRVDNMRTLNDSIVQAAYNEALIIKEALSKKH